MASIGYFMTYGSGTASEISQNSLFAATVPHTDYNGQMSLKDLLKEAEINKTDTIVLHDTVEVKNTKYVKVPAPGHATDTIYVPLAELPEVEVVPVKQPSQEDREEYTSDETRDGPKPLVVLTIDGKVVYASENDIHSGRSSTVNSTSAFDEP